MANTKTTSKEKTTVSYPQRYSVIIHNDDFTPMEFVVQLLIEIFNKTIDDATDITMTIHSTGKAIAGVYSFEVAEQKTHEANIISRHHGHPLKITVEPVV
jgi:ATP-dependent Clp protease adaptor protein ClpS